MSSHKTILKNTLYLYVRMFLTMGVGLYTSRIVLKALGVEDFGIYGVVGGIVTMFAVLNAAMSSATQRYLTYDLGKGDPLKLQKTFNASLNIHFLIALIFLILAETVGLWFVNAKLKVPLERMNAANWVYQFSIFTFALDVIQVPYNALLIARERMSIYAYISIAEAALNLSIAFIIVNAETDRLILYGALIFLAAYITRMSYKFYCKKHFEEAKYKFYYNKAYYIEILSFSGWNLFGNVAVIARNQGSNILLNIFFGPVANAAYSLTLTVQNAIRQFVSGFQVAANPQITKDFAKGELKRSQDLMLMSSKFSYFMMLLLIMPFIFNLDYLVTLWLGSSPPPYTIAFMKGALIFTLIETLSGPLVIGLQATGKIKIYQAVVGTIVFLNFPLVWITLKMTPDPVAIYWVFCIISVIALAARLFFLNKLMDLDVWYFIRKVIYPVVLSTILILILVYLFSLKITPASNFINLIFESIVLLTFGLIPILIIGITAEERRKFKQILIKKIKK